MDYAYDLSGRMISENRTENGTALKSSYIYDALGQLTEFKQSNGYSENYSYDAVGNMSAKTVTGIKTNYTYNAANQLMSDGTSEYSYDANGNLVEKSNDGGVTSYTYNALSLLENWTDGSTSENYSYNASGLLSSVENNGVTTELTWDILYGDGEVIESRTNEAVTDYTYGLERISALTDKTRTEYVYDGRGSVAAELSYNTAWYTLGGAFSDKSVITKSYTPFGEQLAEETSGFGYNGEYCNAATGTVYLRARFYEPEMNRFSQKDIVRGSITNPNSLNRYSYVQNDPINFIDPSGESLKSAWNSAKNAVTNAVTKAVNGIKNVANKAISGVKNFFGGGTKPTNSAGSASNAIITNTQTGSGSGAFGTTYLMGYGGKANPNTQNPSVKGPTNEIEVCNITRSNEPSLTWKKMIKNIRSFSKEVIYPSIEFYAGVGQGIGGSLDILKLEGIDLEYSANYFEVRLDNGKWSWGQRLNAEASIDLLTLEIGSKYTSVTDNNGEELSDWSSSGAYAEIKLPDEISASLYPLFFGGSFSMKINYEELLDNLEEYMNQER